MKLSNSTLDLSMEIILSDANSARSQAIRRAVKAGKLRKIASKIYTSNLTDLAEDIIQRHRYFIISELFPNAVISHRSALEGGFAKDNSIVLTYRYSKNISLPGLNIRLVKGHGPLDNDTTFLENLSISSRARALLENLQPSRSRAGIAKNLDKATIEKHLDKIIRIYGEAELNQLRDEAKTIAEQLNLKKELALLNSMVGTLLGTRKDYIPTSQQGYARSQQLAYDPYRIELFTNLAAHLVTALLKKTPCTLTTASAKRHFAFFEAYFSNFIEGTEFEIEEAEGIIFQGKIIPNRSDDSHDILATYKIVSNQAEMNTCPENLDKLIGLLKKRHGILLEPRLDKRPGNFKDKVNRAGNTVFVKPEEVTGTFAKGLELYQSLEPGIKRAIYMMFLVSEVHPFLDGNGRIARIMMNAELSKANENKIIIPTVYREDYILALRRLSRENDPEPFVRMLEKAQHFCSKIDFTDYQAALNQLEAANAFADPTEAKLVMGKNYNKKD